MTKSLKKGDKVKWDTSQGETHGTVVGKVTSTSKAGGHTAKATKSEPQYRVKSAKTGKEAIHHAKELRRG